MVGRLAVLLCFGLMLFGIFVMLLVIVGLFVVCWFDGVW